MIDYNRNLSYERETHRMSILVLLETLILIKKNVSVSFMLFYVQYQIPQLVLAANSIFSTLYALMDSSFWFETINLRRSIVYVKGSQVIISKQKNISFSEDILCLSKRCRS